MAVESLRHVVIVGASLAGLHAAQALRRASDEVSITLIGAEPHLPYDRPPLSKHFLRGDWDEEKLRLRAAADPDALGLDWRLGVVATGLDLERRHVLLGSGEEIGFDGLVIATGAAVRTLPDSDLDGVHVLRTLDDARGLRAAFDREPDRVVVIGAGFIGAEVAATARERGLEVTIVEAAETPMSRVLDAASGRAVAALHRANGVEVRLGTGVAGFTSRAGAVSGVELADGTDIDTDTVVVGIGVVPNVGWLEGAGLQLDNGVVCDETCLAAAGVVAAGDVANWSNRRFGPGTMRIEQWDNAVEQGGYVARRLLAWAADEPIEPFAPVPWFWSDQYDRKIQLAGRTSDRVEVLQGSLEEQRFVQMYLDDDGRPVGVQAWNRPRQAIQSRQLLAIEADADEFRSTLGPPPE